MRIKLHRPRLRGLLASTDRGSGCRYYGQAVIDALVADAIYPREGGLRVSCGHMSLAIECSERDAEAALALDPDAIVIFTVFEIDGDRISTPVLVGAVSETRRELYQVLRELRGIGRRSALNILDCGEKVDILRAVAGDDREFFAAVPGLGPKRIAALAETLARHYDGAMPKPLPIPVSDWVTIRDALITAGMSWEVAETEIAAALEEDVPADPETLLELLGQ